MSVRLSRGGRYFVGGALVVCLTWLFAFSDPLPSLGWEVLAGMATLVLAIAGVVGVAGRPLAPGSRRRVPRLPTVVAVVIAAATVGLCGIRAPMWVRFYQARPAMLELAAEAQRGGGHHRALAGTYYLKNFGLQDYRFDNPDDPGADAGPRHSGYVFFDTNDAGLFTEAGFVYSPLGEPAALDRAGGVDNSQYRHLTGPWWIFARDVF